jgi:hypothetical protein
MLFLFLCIGHLLLYKHLKITQPEKKNWRKTTLLALDPLVETRDPRGTTRAIDKDSEQQYLPDFGVQVVIQVVIWIGRVDDRWLGDLVDF